ncbi:DUF7661 family protein [Shewanella marina]|uniref:DUF7661 family protein n=1 Tax=Shewanella marina TaxID=487319 RepID=UPI00046F7BAE|nr:hypothetical protein [Shewanella marina]
MIKFDVFGDLMLIDRQQGQWLLFKSSGTGLRVRIYDVVIPKHLNESELAQYLDDIFHERASAQYPQVIKLNN